MKVWDAPIRLFHWAVVILIGVSYAAWWYDRMGIHVISGECMLALLLFRFAWGFLGSDTARFRSFLTSPAAGIRHLMHIGRREPDNEVGHNAAGGWMVLLMLLVLAAQVGTGLFATDDVATDGPLANLVSYATSEELSHIHALLFDVILATIGLHLLAILTYAVLKRQNLLRPMITGRKRLPATMRPPRMASPALALLLLAIAAIITWIIAAFG